MKPDENKKLILLIPGFAADELDSTCLPAQQAFMLALRRKFPDLLITVIAFQYPFKRGWYQWNGISVMALNGRNKGGIHRLRVWISAWNCLRKLKREGRLIGLLSFWCTETALIGKWFGRLNNLKHYCWILGQDARKSNGLVKLINPSSNELIALSDFLQGEFEKNHDIKPAHVIPNAIDPTSFPPLQTDRSIHLIGVGSLISLKRYDVFLSIVKKLIDLNPSLKAVICGKGPEEELLQHLISESGLKKNVSLLGEKPHQEILQLLQESKILLHPSSYEGYSTVCLEALYAGAHVISFMKPDQHKVEQWHVVHSVGEMEQKVMELLSRDDLYHKRVSLYTVDESAVAVMKLFGIEVTAS